VSPTAARREGENIAKTAAAVGTAALNIGEYLKKKNKVDLKLHTQESDQFSRNASLDGYRKARLDKRLAGDGSNLEELFREHMSPALGVVADMPEGMNKRISNIAMQKHMNARKSDMVKDMIQFDAADKSRRVEKFRESLTTTVMGNPDEASVDESINLFKTYVDSIGLDPVTRNKVMDEFNENIDMAVVNGHSLRGEYDKAETQVMQSDSFSAEEKLTLVKDIKNQRNQAINTDYTNNQRIRKQAKDDLKDQRESFEQDVATRLFEAKTLGDINAIENEVRGVISTNSSMATRSVKALVAAFKDPEAKLVRDTTYFEFQERIFKGQDMKALLNDINMSMSQRMLSPRDGVILINRLRANMKKAGGSKVFSMQQKAATTLLRATLRPNGINIDFPYVGEKASLVAEIRATHIDNVKKGMDPLAAMRKALIQHGRPARVVVRNVPPEDQADPADLVRTQKKIIKSFEDGQIKSKEQIRKAEETLRDIEKRNEQEADAKMWEDIIKFDTGEKKGGR
jgi:hypothetical protein